MNFIWLIEAVSNSKWRVVLITSIFGIVGGFYSYFTYPLYQSNVHIVLPVINNAIDELHLKNAYNLYIRTLLSNNAIRSVYSKYYVSAYKLLDIEPRSFDSFQRSFKIVDDRYKNTGVVLNFTDNNPLVAARSLNFLIKETNMIVNSMFDKFINRDAIFILDELDVIKSETLNVHEDINNYLLEINEVMEGIKLIDVEKEVLYNFLDTTELINNKLQSLDNYILKLQEIKKSIRNKSCTISECFVYTDKEVGVPSIPIQSRASIFVHFLLMGMFVGIMYSVLKYASDTSSKKTIDHLN